MKKVITVLLAVTMLFTFVACKQSTGTLIGDDSCIIPVTNLDDFDWEGIWDYTAKIHTFTTEETTEIYKKGYSTFNKKNEKIVVEERTTNYHEFAKFSDMESYIEAKNFNIDYYENNEGLLEKSEYNDEEKTILIVAKGIPVVKLLSTFKSNWKDFTVTTNTSKTSIEFSYNDETSSKTYIYIKR